MFVCVFMSYILSMTVQKHDTPLTIWHLASQRERGRERERACVCARVCVHEGRKGAMIEVLAVPPKSGSTVPHSDSSRGACKDGEGGRELEAWVSPRAVVEEGRGPVLIAGAPSF